MFELFIQCGSFPFIMKGLALIFSWKLVRAESKIIGSYTTQNPEDV